MSTETRNVATDLPGGMPVIVGRSARFLEVLALAERAASSDAKVLVTGESGVGKDLVARYIHINSKRARGPFVAVNCAGLTETLLESELFGHVRGSFTDAYRDKPGKLQLADHGTLFLDEVGEMSQRMQALLLRFLETGELQAVGAHQGSVSVNVRIIAATNRNLAERVAAGEFREDLLYRLRVIALHVPALREHREDIPDLVHHFLLKTGRPITVTAEAMDVLQRYRWPGNVRELQNVVEQTVWLAPGETVDVTHLPPNVSSTAQALQPTTERRRQVADELYDALSSSSCSFWDHVYPLFIAHDLTRHDIRELVIRGLRATHGNYRALLDAFGISPSDYKRFQNFLDAHGCRVDFRPFRQRTAQPERERWPLLPPSPPNALRASKGARHDGAAADRRAAPQRFQ